MSVDGDVQLGVERDSNYYTHIHTDQRGRADPGHGSGRAPTRTAERRGRRWHTGAWTAVHGTPSRAELGVVADELDDAGISSAWPLCCHSSNASSSRARLTSTRVGVAASRHPIYIGVALRRGVTRARCGSQLRPACPTVYASTVPETTAAHRPSSPRCLHGPGRITTLPVDSRKPKTSGIPHPCRK